MELNLGLRHMPEIQNIAAYLREMKFKHKAFGGCDEESVLDHISHITLQYEAIVSALLTREEQNACHFAALQSELAQTEQDSAVLVEWHEQMTARLQADNDLLRRRLAAYQAELDQRRQTELPPPAWYGASEQNWLPEPSWQRA